MKTYLISLRNEDYLVRKTEKNCSTEQKHKIEINIEGKKKIIALKLTFNVLENSFNFPLAGFAMNGDFQNPRLRNIIGTRTQKSELQNRQENEGIL